MAKQKLRIGIFYNVPSGGAKRAIFEMAKGLANRGHSLVEVVPSTAELDWCSLAPFVASRKIFPFNWPQWRKRIPFLTPYLHLGASTLGLIKYHLFSKALARWLESSQLDVLFANDCAFTLNPPIVGYSNVPSLLYVHHGSHLSCEASDNRSLDVPLVERLKSVYYSPTRILWNNLKYSSETWAARRARSIACNSTVAQRMIKQAYGTNVNVVHYGVDTLVFSPESKMGLGEYVFSAGYLTRHKSFDFIIKSLATLPEQVRPPLIIASTGGEIGEKEYLQDLARCSNVSLTILKPQSSSELIQLYREAKVFVFAARYEAFGLVVLEAMACGTPVVGVEDGGYVDCMVEGVTGFVTPRSPDAFGQAVRKLLENPRLRQDMGYQARQRVLEYWTWERAVDELEGYLCQVSIMSQPRSKG